MYLLKQLFNLLTSDYFAAQFEGPSPCPRAQAQAGGHRRESPKVEEKKEDGAQGDLRSRAKFLDAHKSSRL